MRVFFANACFDPTVHEGSRGHFEGLSAGLSALGHEVWTTVASPLGADRRLPLDTWARRLELLRVDAIYMRVEGHSPPDLASGARRLLSRRLARIPLVWEVNSASDLVAFAPDGSCSRMRELDDRLRRSAPLVQLAVCNTEGLSNYMDDIGVRVRRVIPLGSDPGHFRPAAPKAPEIEADGATTRVVWCGNTAVGWHDLDVLRRAAIRLVDRPDIRVYVIGDPIPGLDLPANATLLGRRSYDEMPGLLASMSIGVATYRRPDWSRYGVFSSPLKLFDYFASGLPVIGSPAEQVEKCLADGRAGVLVPFGDDEHLAKAIVYLADNPSERLAKGSYARSLVEDYFNWDRVARETADCIAAVRTPLLRLPAETTRRGWE
ncbi:MAG: glycosyltransferase [Armatimonadetes bacterium]|nr:glycosyltransferase [Armatimonadota bacterium]